MTHLGRTLVALRRAGWLAGPVEAWIPHTKPPRRRDLFSVGDVLAAHPRDKLFLLVQVTALPDVSARVAKARQSPDLVLWLQAGGLFEVWGWTRRGKRWTTKRVALTGADLAATVLQAPPRRRGGRQWHPLPLFDVDVNPPSPKAADTE